MEITEIFLAVVVALILIMMSFQFAKLLSQAAQGKIVGHAIYQLVALYTVKLFVLLTPFAFFVSALIALSKMASDNELIAMKSLGYSDSKIYHALFAVAIPLALLVLLLTTIVLPKVSLLSYQLTEKAKKESELSIIQPGHFRAIGHNATLFVASVDSKHFSKLFIWQKNGDKQSITVAKAGQQIEKEGERHIVLSNGSRYSWSKDSAYFMLFERFLALLPPIKTTSQATKTKSIPTTKLMDTPTLTNRVEFQRRLTPAISILILALCAPLLVAFNPRENRYGKFVIAILIYALYLNSESILGALVKDGEIPAFPGIYTAHLSFLGLLLLWLFFRYPPAVLKNPNGVRCD